MTSKIGLISKPKCSLLRIMGKVLVDPQNYFFADIKETIRSKMAPNDVKDPSAKL